MSFKQITWDQFEESYKPQQNHLDDNASFNGWMYETYGKELEYIQSLGKSAPQRVWTIVEGDYGVMIIITGYHLVNRQGYIITELPWEQEEIEVLDPEDLEEAMKEKEDENE